MAGTFAIGLTSTSQIQKSIRDEKYRTDEQLWIHLLTNQQPFVITLYHKIIRYNTKYQFQRFGYYVHRIHKDVKN